MKKLNNLAKEINELLLKNPTIKEYLMLKKEIEEDKVLQELKNKLDVLRKEICKEKDRDSEDYFLLLDQYKQNFKIRRFESLKKEIQAYFVEISDILSLN